MKVVVDRFLSDAETTISNVTVDGSFVCFGLEDEHREKKVPKETRIPAGKYDVRLLLEGDHHKRYSTRFSDIHQGMLHLQDVPNFTGILIHVGNTDKDTSGCLIVGSQAVTEPKKLAVTQSVAAYRRLYQIVVAAAKAGNLTIEIQDNDRPLAAAVAAATSNVSARPPAGRRKKSKRRAVRARRRGNG
jgi:hypothetical protein